MKGYNWKKRYNEIYSEATEKFRRLILDSQRSEDKKDKNVNREYMRYICKNGDYCHIEKVAVFIDHSPINLMGTTYRLPTSSSISFKTLKESNPKTYSYMKEISDIDKDIKVNDDLSVRVSFERNTSHWVKGYPSLDNWRIRDYYTKDYYRKRKKALFSKCMNYTLNKMVEEGLKDEDVIQLFHEIHREELAKI